MTEERDMAKDISKEAAQRLGHDDPLMLITKEETEDSWDLTCYGCQKPILDMSKDISKEAAQRLGHDDPLMLITKEETEDSSDLTCYGCQKPILDMSFYGCKDCLFFLHQSCGDPPQELTYPHHPQHPLKFRPIPAYKGICDVCREDLKRFIYHCSRCKYDIDMKCALVMLSIQQRIQHKSHPHQLIPLLHESMFLCAACGIKHQGTSFLCTTCGYWINQKCASSPLNLKLSDHPGHTLSLFYFIEEDFNRLPCCKICSQTIQRRYWVYRCSECKSYVVHLQCAAASAQDRSTNNKTKTEQLDSTNSATATSDFELSKVPSMKIKAQEPIIDLPMPGDSVDIITQFIKSTRIHIEGKYKEAAEIEHFTHDHPLTYFEKPIDPPASGSISGTRNAEKCNGCAQSISAPFYHCVECNFFLHAWCAELPDKLRHPSHPEHTLSRYTFRTFAECSCCKVYGNVLFYSCSEACSEFILDCKCASLPRVIKHEAHKHNLALRPTSVCTCISCGVESSVSYECGGCKHYLCVRCALLPRTIRHRYDKLHPFTLTYSCLTYQTKDDFCEICEEEIDSNHWFYHCGECNRYLHTECIFPTNKNANVVHGHSVKTGLHPHRLTCVQPNEDLCSLCKRNCRPDSRVGYLCSACEFFLCGYCRRDRDKGYI